MCERGCVRHKERQIGREKVEEINSKAKEKD